MGYYEKGGRLFDPATHADRGPAKARLDADRTAVGETRIVQHVSGENPDLVCMDERFSLGRNPELEDRNGNRTPLAARPETIKPELSPEMRSVLRTAAASILGSFSIVGLSLRRMAQAMREMPTEFDSVRYEKTDLYWLERLAKAKDWLAVYDQGH